MMRLISIVLLCVSLLFGNCDRALAQTKPTPEQLQQLDTLAQKAIKSTNAGDFATAETYWTEIIEQFPDNPAAVSNRGNARISQNKLIEAVSDFDKAIELAPTATDPYLNRGTALEGLGKWDEAIADYNKSLQFNPKNASAYYNLGITYERLEDYTLAIANYTKTIESSPNYAPAYENRGNLLDDRCDP